MKLRSMHFGFGVVSILTEFLKRDEVDKQSSDNIVTEILSEVFERYSVGSFIVWNAVYFILTERGSTILPHVLAEPPPCILYKNICVYIEREIERE